MITKTYAASNGTMLMITLTQVAVKATITTTTGTGTRASCSSTTTRPSVTTPSVCWLVVSLFATPTATPRPAVRVVVTTNWANHSTPSTLLHRRTATVVTRRLVSLTSAACSTTSRISTSLRPTSVQMPLHASPRTIAGASSPPSRPVGESQRSRSSRTM